MHTCCRCFQCFPSFMLFFELRFLQINSTSVWLFKRIFVFILCTSLMGPSGVIMYYCTLAPAAPFSVLLCCWHLLLGFQGQVRFRMYKTKWDCSLCLQIMTAQCSFLDLHKTFFLIITQLSRLPHRSQTHLVTECMGLSKQNMTDLTHKPLQRSDLSPGFYYRWLQVCALFTVRYDHKHKHFTCSLLLQEVYSNLRKIKQNIKIEILDFWFHFHNYAPFLPAISISLIGLGLFLFSPSLGISSGTRCSLVNWPRLEQAVQTQLRPLVPQMLKVLHSQSC